MFLQQGDTYNKSLLCLHMKAHLATYEAVRQMLPPSSAQQSINPFALNVDRACQFPSTNPVVQRQRSLDPWKKTSLSYPWVGAPGPVLLSWWRGIFSKYLTQHHRLFFNNCAALLKKCGVEIAISAVKSMSQHGRSFSKIYQNFSSLRVGVPTTFSKHNRTHVLHCQSRGAHVCKSNVFAWHQKGYLQAEFLTPL